MLKTNGSTLLAAAVLSFTACASSGRDVSDAEVGQVEMMIRSAENARAPQYAKELYDRARSALSAAQSDRARGKDREARRHLSEAQAAAVAAESRAKAAALQAQVDAAKREADELDRRTKQLNDAGRR